MDGWVGWVGYGYDTDGAMDWDGFPLAVKS